MTHPTIEKALEEANNHAFQEDERASERMIQAAARVILAAEPSYAEVEAAARELHSISDSVTNWPFLLEWQKNQYRSAARAALKAAYAAKAKEMGL